MSAAAQEADSTDGEGNLRFTVFAIEHSLEPPVKEWGDATFSHCFSRAVRRVPVLHLFGYTLDRRTVCVHLHGRMPYFFVPVYDPRLSPVDFGAQLELAAVSHLRLDSAARVVHDVSVVRGLPLYGFTETPRLFFRISLYSPTMINRIANLVGSTTFVAGRRWQPYEGHVPFHFQTMVDLGVSGMSVVAATRGSVRSGSAAVGGLDVDRFPTVEASRVSTAQFEADIDVAHFQPKPVSAGAHLDVTKGMLQAYLTSIDEPHTLLDDAVRTDGLERWTIPQVQALDPLVPVMRERAREIEVQNRRPETPARLVDDADTKHVKHDDTKDDKDKKTRAVGRRLGAAGALLKSSTSDPCVAPTPTSSISQVPPTFMPQDGGVPSMLQHAQETLRRRQHDQPAAAAAPSFDDDENAASHPAGDDEDDGAIGLCPTYNMLAELADLAEDSHVVEAALGFGLGGDADDIQGTDTAACERSLRSGERRMQRLLTQRQTSGDGGAAPQTSTTLPVAPGDAESANSSVGELGSQLLFSDSESDTDGLDETDGRGDDAHDVDEGAAAAGDAASPGRRGSTTKPRLPAGAAAEPVLTFADGVLQRAATQLQLERAQTDALLPPRRTSTKKPLVPKDEGGGGDGQSAGVFVQGEDVVLFRDDEDDDEALAAATAADTNLQRGRPLPAEDERVLSFASDDCVPHVAAKRDDHDDDDRGPSAAAKDNGDADDDVPLVPMTPGGGSSSSSDVEVIAETPPRPRRGTSSRVRSAGRSPKAHRGHRAEADLIDGHVPSVEVLGTMEESDGQIGAPTRAASLAPIRRFTPRAIAPDFDHVKLSDSAAAHTPADALIAGGKRAPSSAYRIRGRLSTSRPMADAAPPGYRATGSKPPPPPAGPSVGRAPASSEVGQSFSPEALAELQAAVQQLKGRRKLPPLLTARLRHMTQLLELMTRPTAADGQVGVAGAAGFAVADNRRGARRVGRTAGIAFLRVLAVEAFSRPRPHKASNPGDPMELIVMAESTSALHEWTMIAFTSVTHRRLAPPDRVRLETCDSERTLLQRAMHHLQSVDPDVLVSWDVQRGGVSAFLDRYARVIGVDPSRLVSRLGSLNVPSASGADAISRRQAGQGGVAADGDGPAEASGGGGEGDADGSSNAGASDDDSAHSEGDVPADDTGGDAIRRHRFGRRVRFADAMASRKAAGSSSLADSIGLGANAGAVASGLSSRHTSPSPGAQRSAAAAAPAAPAGPTSLAASVFGDRAEAPSGDGARSANMPLAAGSGKITIAGRVVIGMWRVVRSEVKQKSYTIGAMAEGLLGETFPVFDDWTFSELLHGTATGVPGGTGLDSDVALRHAIRRVEIVLRLARHLDVFVRTSEMAQIYGILFVEVLSRGSQFRVEATLHRFAKPLGYVMVSPSREQVMMQNRQEGIALVMEPYSAFYTDPVVVLDFRSLYPSIVTAYNLCFSTLLGKVSSGKTKKIGAISGYRQPPGFVDDCAFAPNSAAYVNKDVRLGVLPQMLDKILKTRFMVQACMKKAAAKGDEEQRRVFDAQQTGLKLLANVTYGYCAATFTGRMPCSDISDAIVLLGRQTLERAIRLIEGTPKFRAKVVYGDTDSLFIQLQGCSRADAFGVAAEMVRAVNEQNPQPVHLKFEKVYHPCFMIVKKRYVGYAWESPSQTEPRFDAKGTESIRRDQCPATSKLQRALLETMFNTRDLRLVRRQFVGEVSKLMRNEVLPTDVILRNEVRLGTYARDSTLPPGARVALRMMQNDPGLAPTRGERVPYIVANETGAQLKDMVRHPMALVTGSVPPTINSDHYVVKHLIPSMNRIFHLVGVDFAVWYKHMARLRPKRDLFSAAIVTWSPDEPAAPPLAPQAARHATGGRQGGLELYYQHGQCVGCGHGAACTPPHEPPVCERCLRSTEGRGDAYRRALRHVTATERDLEDLTNVCGQCATACNAAATSRCRNIDCNVLFQRHRAERLLWQWRIAMQYFAQVPVDSAPPQRHGGGNDATSVGQHQRQGGAQQAASRRAQPRGATAADAVPID